MQFASGMKDSSKEETGGAKSLLLWRPPPLERTIEACSPDRAAQVSSSVGRILRMLRASSAQILEFKKILGAIIMVSLPLEMTGITAL
jgi:hypothetical protein